MSLMNSCNIEEIMEQYLYQRTERNPIPLLVIGLGGIGTSIMQQVKQTFCTHFQLPSAKNPNERPVPEHTAFLSIDTEDNRRLGLSRNEFVDIYMHALPSHLDSLMMANKRPPIISKDEACWLDQKHPIGHGYMQRQSGRFQLVRKYNEVRAALHNALSAIFTQHPGEKTINSPAEIIICTSLCGETGSGIFLDVPQIVRHIMMTDPTLMKKYYNISGMFVMPDVPMMWVQNSPMAAIMARNGYAALKELDFWMQVGDHKTPYTMHYGNDAIVWERPPYDTCYLLGNTNERNPLPDPLGTIQKAVADYLMLSLLTPTNSVTMAFFQHVNKLHQSLYYKFSRPPLYYGYSTLGMYTLHLPRKKALLYASSLLLDTFMHDVPNDALIKDGQVVQRAQTVIGNAGKLHAAFAQTLPLPGFCNVTAADKPRIEAMQQMDPRPHDQEDCKPAQWITAIVKPAAGTSGEQYLDAAWSRFCDFCAFVMSKPELGPYALHDYLDHPDKGLVKALEAEVNSWINLARNFKNNLSALKQACTATWTDFEHPPLLSRTKAIEAYLQNLNSYYAGLRKYVYMDTYANAAQKLLHRIKSYLFNSLKPLCKNLEKLRKACDHLEKDNDPTSDDALSLKSIKPYLNTEFNAANENKRLSITFLRTICQDSLRYDPKADAHYENGFPNCTQACEDLIRCLFDMLKELEDIPTLSIDSLMRRTTSDNECKQKEYLKEMGNILTTRTLPLLMQSQASCKENVCQYSCCSVPDNAPEHLKYLQYVLDFPAHGSRIRDRISCLKIEDFHSLNCYGMMETLHRHYVNALSNPIETHGLHLVYTGDPDADYTKNWFKLPEPLPFFYFETTGNANEEAAWHQIQLLAERALDCGMLEISEHDSSNDQEVLLHVFWTDASHTELLPPQELTNRAKHIMSLKTDPETGSPITEKQQLNMLKALEAEATTLSLRTPAPILLAHHLGMDGVDIDPRNVNIIGDPVRIKAAKENLSKMLPTIAAAALNKYPHFQQIILQQIEAFQCFSACKKTLNKM